MRCSYNATARLVALVCWFIGVVGVLYLLSDYANASASDEKAKQAEYVAGLEKIVAACLSDSTGKPVMIGDEWFLCGIVPIGRIK